MIKNSEKLDELADVVGEKEYVLGHLNDQREVLVDNYIKG